VSGPSGIEATASGSLSKPLEEIGKGVEIIGISLVRKGEGHPVEIVKSISAGEPVEKAPKGIVVHVVLLVVACRGASRNRTSLDTKAGRVTASLVSQDPPRRARCGSRTRNPHTGLGPAGPVALVPLQQGHGSFAVGLARGYRAVPPLCQTRGSGFSRRGDRPWNRTRCPHHVTVVLYQ
jgi:hypothetical protein